MLRSRLARSNGAGIFGLGDLALKEHYPLGQRLRPLCWCAPHPPTGRSVRNQGRVDPTQPHDPALVPPHAPDDWVEPLREQRKPAADGSIQSCDQTLLLGDSGFLLDLMPPQAMRCSCSRRARPASESLNVSPSLTASPIDRSSCRSPLATGRPGSCFRIRSALISRGLRDALGLRSIIAPGLMTAC
jgi:hypothetical protein